MKDTIVVATINCEKALYVIAKSAVNYDEIEIKYVDKYAPTVEYLLRMLRKGFGWFEKSRSIVNVTNTRCRWNNQGICTHKDTKGELHCKEAVRLNCKTYEKLFNNVFRANVVVIEKAGGIRGID